MEISEKPFILIVEDNLGDAKLIREALKESAIQAALYFLSDGSSAIRFLDESKQKLFQTLPRLVLLDLNLPGKSGHEVLQHIKTDEKLKRIPVIVLSSSFNPDDINQAYDLHANCYLNKPIDFEPFTNIVKAIEYFWLHIANLPSTS